MLVPGATPSHIAATAIYATSKGWALVIPPVAWARPLRRPHLHHRGPLDPATPASHLAGYVMSTSVLSPVVLGDRATEFADDLRRALHASRPDGLFRQTIIFACDLARRPA